MKLRTPAYLAKGDKVALISPASFVTDSKAVILAEELLTSWGFVPVRGKHILAQDGSFAGTDAQRLEDLQNALDNPEIKAVWAMRGGYGLTRIIADLDFTKFLKNPKWIIGFSDVTALHNVLHKLNYKSIHAFMPIQLIDKEPASEFAKDSLLKALTGIEIRHKLPGCTLGKTGSIDGVLVGGNLSLLVSLLGTKQQLKTKGKILFIEDVGEPLYKIDRMMQSLKLAGCLKDLKGLIVGGITDVKASKHDFGKTYHNIINDVVDEYDYPLIFDIASGHFSDNRALVLGEETVIKVGEFISCIIFGD